MAGKSSLIRTSARLLKESLDDFIKDDGPRMSAALAYYSAFSLAPLLLIAVAIAGAFFGDEAVRGALDGELRRAMGPSAALVVQDMVAHARKPADNLLVSAIGITLLLAGAAGLFGQLQAALNTIWKVGPPRGRGVSKFIRNLSAVVLDGAGYRLPASSYGSAGAFVLVLMWLYYSSMILLFGAEFTEIRARHRQSRATEP